MAHSTIQLDDAHVPTRLTLTLPILKLLSRMDFNSSADTSAAIPRNRNLNSETYIAGTKIINCISTVTSTEHLHTVITDRKLVATLFYKNKNQQNI